MSSRSRFYALFPRVVDTPEIFRHGMGDLSLQSYLDMWGSAQLPASFVRRMWLKLPMPAGM